MRFLVSLIIYIAGIFIFVSIPRDEYIWFANTFAQFIGDIMEPVTWWLFRGL